MKKITILLIFLGSIFNSCELDTSLDVKNKNDPDYKSVLSNPEDLEKILVNAYVSMFRVFHQDAHLPVIADQATHTTEPAIQFASQPRRRFENNKNNKGSNINKLAWKHIYNGIRGANHVVRWIENDKNAMLLSSTSGTNKIDKTKESLASAYFIKGVCEGYLAMIFDKGYIADWNSTLEEATTPRVPKEILESAVSNIEKSIEIAKNSDDSFSSEFINKKPLDKKLFVQLANSFLARILIGFPRTKTEALQTDFSKIINYANQGITEDFFIPFYKQGDFLSALLVLSQLDFFGNLSFHLDQKVVHLIDPSQPKDYPTDATILPPVKTNDTRIKDYFEYRKSFGNLNKNIDRSLFSSYKIKNRWGKALPFANPPPGTQQPVFLVDELRYIKAEAVLKSQGVDKAREILDQTARKTRGGLDTGNTYPEVLKALHYEYAVELMIAGGNTCQWSFMRRNDLLQKGSLTMLPIPHEELEAQGIATTYSFGGLSGVGKSGTASTEGWKDENSYNK